jgi:hypothetical protein
VIWVADGIKRAVSRATKIVNVAFGDGKKGDT